MSEINVIITNIGLAKMASATAEHPLMIEKFAVGDGNGAEIELNTAMTGLVNEKHRDFINDKYASNNQCTFECILRGNAPIEKGFYLRELGLFDKKGALIAIAKLPQSYRPALIEGNILTENIFNVGLKLENSEHIAISVPENIFVRSDNLAREVEILDNKIDNLHSTNIKLARATNFNSIVNVQEALDALHLQNQNLLNMNRNFYKMQLGVMMYLANDINPMVDNSLVKWSWCEGQNLLVADYPDLYRVLGNRWGGVPNVNFNLPDSRNRVIRNTGADMPWGYQEDAGQRITGQSRADNIIWDGNGSISGQNNGCVRWSTKYRKVDTKFLVGVDNHVNAEYGHYAFDIDSALVARTSH